MLVVAVEIRMMWVLDTQGVLQDTPVLLGSNKIFFLLAVLRLPMYLESMYHWMGSGLSKAIFACLSTGKMLVTHGIVQTAGSLPQYSDFLKVCSWQHISLQIRYFCSHLCIQCC